MKFLPNPYHISSVVQAHLHGFEKGSSTHTIPNANVMVWVEGVNISK